MERRQEIDAEQREDQQDSRRDGTGAQGHVAALRRVRALGQSGIDRCAAGRIDDHKQGHEGGEEEFGHVSSHARSGHRR